MSNNFSNLSGTTSSEFQISSGSTALVRHLVLTGTGGSTATNRESQSIGLGDYEFYDLKFIATEIVSSVTTATAEQHRGMIANSVVSKVDDIFLEDLATAGITITNVSGNLIITCAGAASINYTISITLTRMG
jgi:hypothetical protein